MTVTGAVAAVLAAAVWKRWRVRVARDRGPGVSSEEPQDSERHEATSDEMLARPRRRNEALSQFETRSIFDTQETASGEFAQTPLEPQSYPIDVDDLGASWLTRATQTTPRDVEMGPDAVLVEDPFPTLDQDELADALPPSEEPDSEWLRATEAMQRKGRRSGEHS